MDVKLYDKDFKGVKCVNTITATEVQANYSQGSSAAVAHRVLGMLVAMAGLAHAKAHEAIDGCGNSDGNGAVPKYKYQHQFTPVDDLATQDKNRVMNVGLVVTAIFAVIGFISTVRGIISAVFNSVIEEYVKRFASSLGCVTEVILHYGGFIPLADCVSHHFIDANVRHCDLKVLRELLPLLIATVKQFYIADHPDVDQSRHLRHRDKKRSPRLSPGPGAVRDLTQ